MTVHDPFSPPASRPRPGPTRRALLVGCAVGGLCVAAPYARVDAQAFNADPKTFAGTVTYDRATPGIERVIVETPTAIVNWTPNVGGSPINFLPAANEATFVNGPNNMDFVVLNRVLTTTAIQFNGTVLSRIEDISLGTSDPGGTVLFSSPGGIIAGPTALFDVGNLVLTSLNVVDDGAGNFYDSATRGFRFERFMGLPFNSFVGVTTLTGAQITALQPNSYVAIVAPRIAHGGSIQVNGSAAYVGGERVQLRANQGLFDIVVDSGTGNATPIDHVGTTGGPASMAADDIHRIYMVAVPRNVAITALLQGDVGFADAIAANIENGAIVLSAGHGVVGGEVDRFGDFSPPPVPGVAASFHMRGGIVRSDLTGVAVTDMLASGQDTGSLDVRQDISLFADARAHLFTSIGDTVDVGGNALVSAARLRSSDGTIDLVGGDAAIFALPGAITIAGTATVDASAQGGFDIVASLAGSGTGGKAGILAGLGGLVQIGGDASVLATGSGAKPPAPMDQGGAGTGGEARIEAVVGGTLQLGAALAMDAGGFASGVTGMLPAPGAAGTGGTARITSTDGAITVAGPATLTASGVGGAVFAGPANVAGAGQGGNVLIGLDGGTITLNGTSSLSANGQGGNGPTGGAGQGGTLLVNAVNGGIQLGTATTMAATGTGGAGGSIGGADGGDGTGGGVFVQALSGTLPSNIDGGTLSLSATGTGGAGVDGGGNGGDGQGGGVVLTAEAANATLQFGAVTAAAAGIGGPGGVPGGSGGQGSGGNVQVGTVAGPPAPTPAGGATFASLGLGAAGIAGPGGAGGPGGDAAGGTVSLAAEDAPTLVTGAVAFAANGSAGMGGGPFGTGDGGAILIAATGGTGGTLTAGNVTGVATASGAPGTANSPGEWHVIATGGGRIDFANLSLTATATGAPTLRPFSSVEPMGGTINVTQIAQLTSQGQIRVIADGAGTITGGTFGLAAGRDVTLTHSNPAGLTVDVTDFFATAATDFSAAAGVVTRSADETGIVAGGNAAVAGGSWAAISSSTRSRSISPAAAPSAMPPPSPPTST